MKKLITLLLALCILFTFTGTYAEEASLDELKSYGIFEGDENGMRLEDDITKAEFAKVLCCSMGIEMNYSLADDPFKDVPYTHWACGYIRHAVAVALLDFSEDYYFYPESQITHEEAIKSILTAIGYNEYAKAVGHIQTAQKLGLTKNYNKSLSEYAKRQDIAQLIHNALDIPIMQQSGFGDRVEFVIMDGKNDVPLITLRTMLNPMSE